MASLCTARTVPSTVVFMADYSILMSPIRGIRMKLFTKITTKATLSHVRLKVEVISVLSLAMLLISIGKSFGYFPLSRKDLSNRQKPRKTIESRNNREEM